MKYEDKNFILGSLPSHMIMPIKTNILTYMHILIRENIEKKGNYINNLVCKNCLYSEKLILNIYIK